MLLAPTYSAQCIESLQSSQYVVPQELQAKEYWHSRQYAQSQTLHVNVSGRQAGIHPWLESYCKATFLEIFLLTCAESPFAVATIHPLGARAKVFLASVTPVQLFTRQAVFLKAALAPIGPLACITSTDLTMFTESKMILWYKFVAEKTSIMVDALHGTVDAFLW